MLSLVGIALLVDGTTLPLLGAAFLLFGAAPPLVGTAFLRLGEDARSTEVATSAIKKQIPGSFIPLVEGLRALAYKFESA